MVDVLLVMISVVLKPFLQFFKNLTEDMGIECSV